MPIVNNSALAVAPADLKQMQATEHDPDYRFGWTHPETGDLTTTHPVVYLEAAKLLDLAPETWTGIVATARSKFALFLDPIVAENTPSIPRPTNQRNSRVVLQLLDELTFAANAEKNLEQQSPQQPFLGRACP